MSIQKINLSGFYIKKSRNENVTKPIIVNTKNLSEKRGFSSGIAGMKSYISFGQINKPDYEKAVAVNFEDSLQKYYRLKPDAYQIEAAKNIYENADSLVLAPTGTGKTLIAEYAINKNLAEGKTTYYTTPLKALSNEKYSDFCKLYGKENVGLLTGEVKINPGAPVLIMTTEIYRNMLIGNDEDVQDARLEDVATVIYDEFHYMNEPERGEVWETSIMYTPPKIQQLLLSATAQNGDVLKKWMNRLLSEKGAVRESKMVDVPSDERHVPLKYYIFDIERGEKVIPLTKEYYNLKRLSKALKPDTKRNLTGKQKDVLRDISLKIGANLKTCAESSVENGILYLMKNIPETGEVKNIEDLLINNLKYSQPEAERAAAILADKVERIINPEFKQLPVKKAVSKKENRRDYFEQHRPVKIISKDSLNHLAKNKNVSRDTSRALCQLSRKLGGNTTFEDGLVKLFQIADRNDMPLKEFKQKLDKLKLNEEQVEAIIKPLVKLKYPPKDYAEFKLIKILNKENRLPAIFFKFSKKQCDELRSNFLASEKSLLNDEEKLQAAEIIKKHIDKGLFLGTYDNPYDLLSGVAVHHAGKMPGYKALVEELAQNKLLKVVFATSTLGAGINVPAKTVVFTQLSKYTKPQSDSQDKKFISLTPSEFQQMGGRAGRRGKDFIGNVVVMPDKEHGVPSIYQLATAKPDAIISSFKPTYSFVAHFIAKDGTAEHLADAVDKSFLQEMYESLGENPQKIKKKLKKEFVAMVDVLKDEDLNCFETVNGRLVPTIKGDIVSQARGVNGLEFTEVLHNAGLEYLSPEEMAAVACALTPSDDRNINSPVHLEDMVSDTLLNIDSLLSNIDDIQSIHKYKSEPIILNRVTAQYIWNWVDALAQNQKLFKAQQSDSREIWKSTIKLNQSCNQAFTEGDMFKTVNNTVDILEQIKESSSYAAQEYLKEDNEKESEKMRKISDIAKSALKLIKQDPVTYEL